jgi:hypothetical protein
MNAPSLAFISISNYKNPHRLMVHERSYAFNAKHPYAYISSMPEEDFEIAYDEAILDFRSKMMDVCNLYGFDTYSMEGRSEGWLKPHYKGKPMPAVFDDYMTFEEYILEDRMASLFVQIENIFISMKRILKHSVTLDEFRTNMERYMSL